MSQDYVTDEARLLDQIEKRLAAIEARLERFESAAAGFMSGPLVAKMFGAIKNGK